MVQQQYFACRSNMSNNFGNVRSLFCSPGLGLLKGFILIDHSFKSSSKINDHVVFVDVVVMCSKFNRQPRASMSAWANHYLWAGRKKPITTWKGTIEWYLWLHVGALWCMYVCTYDVWYLKPFSRVLVCCIIHIKCTVSWIIIRY